MLLPELVTLFIMAIAVAMDAFSVSLGLGVYKFRLRQIFYIGLSVGLFHVILPLIGIISGNLLSSTLGEITNYIGGGLLMVVGIQMIVSCLKTDERVLVNPVGIFGMLLFSLLLSLDSFSAGLSLGLFGVEAAIAVIIFGIVATGLTWGGLFIGRKAQLLIGVYSELFGGIVLIAFGLKLMLP